MALSQAAEGPIFPSGLSAMDIAADPVGRHFDIPVHFVFVKFQHGRAEGTTGIQRVQNHKLVIDLRVTIRLCIPQTVFMHGSTLMDMFSYIFRNVRPV